MSSITLAAPGNTVRRTWCFAAHPWTSRPILGACLPAVTTHHHLYAPSPAKDDHLWWQHAHGTCLEPIPVVITTNTASVGSLARFRRRRHFCVIFVVSGRLPPRVSALRGSHLSKRPDLYVSSTVTTPHDQWIHSLCTRTVLVLIVRGAFLGQLY